MRKHSRDALASKHEIASVVDASAHTAPTHQLKIVSLIMPSMPRHAAEFRHMLAGTPSHCSLQQSRGSFLIGMPAIARQSTLAEYGAWGSDPLSSAPHESHH